MNYIKLFFALSLSALILIPQTVFAQEASSGVAYGEITSGRLWSTIAAIIGIFSTGLSAQALFRRGKTDTYRQRYARIAGGIGLGVTLYAMIHLTIFTGGFGTGNGRGGAIPAIALGIASIILATIVLIRTRRK